MIVKIVCFGRCSTHNHQADLYLWDWSALFHFLSHL